MKAASDQAVTIAWNTVAMGGQKRLKPLSEYLKPKAAASPEDAAQDLRGMISRMAVKQKGNGDE